MSRVEGANTATGAWRATASVPGDGITHLKRCYGMRRSRLRGLDGAKTTVGWSILTYNLDTLAIRDA